MKVTRAGGEAQISRKYLQNKELRHTLGLFSGHRSKRKALRTTTTVEPS